MRKIFFLLALCLLIPSCGKMGKDGRIKKDIDWSEWYNDDEKASDNKPSVMVMSFNVRYGSASETLEENNWVNRRNSVYAMVNTLRPALMGVQECQKNQREDIEANCTEYGCVGRSRDKTTNGEQMAIFYRKDLVSISEWGTFWLTDTPDEVSKHPAAGHYRCATWAKVTHIQTGETFYHINTHLDLNDVRGFEMDVIMAFIYKNCGTIPVVLTADWNTADTDTIFDEMYQTFSNSRITAATGDAFGTYNGFNNPNSSTRIDHIFYRGFSSCDKFITVRQSWEGHKFISDHYPVYAILKF